MKKKKVKWPFICRLCKLGILKLFCKVCPPLSVIDAQLSTASSGVDEKNQHGVAHSKSKQDEKMREGFSLSSARSCG